MKIFFFFNDTATTEIYTLSLHDALPISRPQALGRRREGRGQGHAATQRVGTADPALLRSMSLLSDAAVRSEEHTSELQSQSNLVCRLLLEKKKTTPKPRQPSQQPHPHASPLLP